MELATPQDRQWLELGEYNCLAVVANQVYNSEGVMFEYTQSRHYPGSFCFQDNARYAVRRNPEQNHKLPLQLCVRTAAGAFLRVKKGGARSGTALYEALLTCSCS